jgi:hypothetical protein
MQNPIYQIKELLQARRRAIKHELALLEKMENEIDRERPDRSVTGPAPLGRAGDKKYRPAG